MGLLNQTDDGRKPLFRKYIANLKKQKVSMESIKETVISIRLSSSEEWILIETENAVAMISAQSKVGEHFWNLATKFQGEMKALCVIPAKGKLGFDIEPHPTLTGVWTYLPDDEKIVFGDVEKKEQGSGMAGLTLESMTLPSASVKSQPKTSK